MCIYHGNNSNTYLLNCSHLSLLLVHKVCCCQLYLSSYYFRFIHKTYHTLVSNPMETIKFFVPAFIYAIQNNLYYIALAHIDATVYSVIFTMSLIYSYHYQCSDHLPAAHINDGISVDSHAASCHCTDAMVCIIYFDCRRCNCSI